MVSRKPVSRRKTWHHELFQTRIRHQSSELSLMGHTFSLSQDRSKISCALTLRTQATKGLLLHVDAPVKQIILDLDAKCCPPPTSLVDVS